MNEDYLKQFRKQPNVSFVGKVHMRLERKERIQTIKSYIMRSALTLTLVFGSLMAFSFTVRAEVIGWIVDIGGLSMETISENPSDPNIPEVELVPDYLSWEQARDRFLSPVQLPTYLPEGYEQEVDTRYHVWGDGTPSVDVIWRKKGQFPMIGLFIAQCQSDTPGCGFYVQEGAMEEIMLNGKPAVLTRGVWDLDTQQYDYSGKVSIKWRYDENTVYDLWCLDPNMADELIKMAESIP